MRKQLFISLAILFFITVGTVFVIIYGKGYQINFNGGKPGIAGTGLLVLKSEPDGAAVSINDHLTTATNNTINLAPGTYKVTIAKEGYFPWTKTIKVQEEVVAKADAFLLTTKPNLESITDTGVNNPALDPTLSRIAFTVASQSAKNKNGIYILNMNASSILTLQSASTQIADDSLDALSTARLSWSPDGKNLLATVETNGRKNIYLLNANSFNQIPQDVTETLTTLTTGWQTDVAQKTQARIDALKTELKQLVQENFNILAWSPDETKILYVASNSAQLPLMITPPLIGSDSTPQDRMIEKGKIYVYDIKEDKNFKIDTANWTYNAEIDNKQHLPLKWMPDSDHLLFVHDKKIDVLEYDGGNKTTVYAGPFVDSDVFSWPDGSKFVVLTDLGNTAVNPNLYTITLK
jgi:Tol biopolymer transport system component